MEPTEAEQLWVENARLVKQNEQLIQAVKILAEKPFNDCFQYLCQSQNECQAFGCEVQKRIREIKNRD